MAIERIVTDSAVFEIADQLTANGEKVTNRAIWTAIGGGSMTTISQSLRRWKEQQEIQVIQPIERTPLPAAIVDVLHTAAAQLWQAAQAETKAELEQLAQTAQARIAEAQGERDESLAELQATADKPSFNEFVRRLHTAEVSVLPSGKTGTPQGVSFEINGQAFKGSNMGKDYAWKQLSQTRIDYEPNRDQGTIDHLRHDPAKPLPPEIDLSRVEKKKEKDLSR